MSYVAESYSGYSNSPYVSATGASSAAHFLRDRARKIEADDRSTGSAQLSYVKTLEQLIQISEDCVAPNWGGDGELPVSEASLENAKRFLELLPRQFQSPDVIPETNGNVAFEWRYGRFRSLIVSFQQQPQIQYSVLLSPVHANFGHCPFVGLIPLDVYRHLTNVAIGHAVP